MSALNPVLVLANVMEYLLFMEFEEYYCTRCFVLLGAQYSDSEIHPRLSVNGVPDSECGGKLVFIPSILKLQSEIAEVIESRRSLIEERNALSHQSAYRTRSRIAEISKELETLLANLRLRRKRLDSAQKHDANFRKLLSVKQREFASQLESKHQQRRLESIRESLKDKAIFEFQGLTDRTFPCEKARQFMSLFTRWLPEDVMERLLTRPNVQDFAANNAFQVVCGWCYQQVKIEGEFPQLAVRDHHRLVDDEVTGTRTCANSGTELSASDICWILICGSEGEIVASESKDPMSPNTLSEPQTASAHERRHKQF